MNKHTSSEPLSTQSGIATEGRYKLVMFGQLGNSLHRATISKFLHERGGHTVVPPGLREEERRKRKKKTLSKYLVNFAIYVCFKLLVVQIYKYKFKTRTKK